MAVYVDELRHRGWVLFGRRQHSCHMIADTVAELHEMATAIGCKRSWFQGQASFPHYDLVASKRREAVRLGAVAVDRRLLVQHIRRIRAQRAA